MSNTCNHISVDISIILLIYVILAIFAKIVIEIITIITCKIVSKPKQFLKLSTYNVELWNGMFDIIYEDGENNKNHHNRNVKSFKMNETKIKQLEEYFSSEQNITEQMPHILGLQESILATNGTDRWKQIGSMNRVARVKAQDATWKTTAQLNSDSVIPASLSNDLYTSPDIEFISAREKVISRDNINPIRVLCIVTLKIYGKYIITVGCVHTTGGRFDDKRSLYDIVFAEEKKYEIEQILVENLDIFMGDFNLKRYRQHVIESSQKWKNELTLEAEKEGKKVHNARVNEWNDWMYINHPSSPNNILDMILEKGYIDATEIGNIKDTTMYGGQVDYIFIKESKFIPVSARAYGEDYTRSDHLIVEAIVQIIN